jgi:hypothetical protein
MHWVLDVTFRDDDCRVRKGDSARNLSAIRKFALSALRIDTRHPERSLRSRKLADRQPNYRVELIGLTPPNVLQVFDCYRRAFKNVYYKRGKGSICGAFGVKSVNSMTTSLVYQTPDCQFGD